MAWAPRTRGARMGAALALLACCWHAPPAWAQGLPGWSGIVAFGDSLTDTGNLGPAAPPPPYADGRFSDGPIWVDRLSALSGLPARSHAYGGAKAEPETPLDLPAQAWRFLAENRGAPGDRLYAVWIGANDYLAALGSLPAGAEQALVRRTVGRTADVVRLLADGGARSVLVLNLPPLSASPEVAGRGASAAARADRLVSAHNAALAAAVAELGARPGLGVAVVDVAGAFAGLLADPGAYGIANLTLPCILSAGLPPYEPSGACPTPEAAAASLFWDRLHPTSTAHAAVADAALKAALALPPPG